ncbi:MAG: alpha/beta fold hydrolase [Bdellovibrionota bacterium]
MARSPAREFRTKLFPYEPRFASVQVAGRSFEMSYVEEGPSTGEPVVLLHGNPTWSFLYRDVIPKLSDKYRVIVPDLLGFGRSDSLPRFEDYTLENHLSAFSQLMDHLKLQNVTLGVHDWGGPIGLSWAVDNPSRIKRLVIQNTWAFAPEPHNKVPQPLKTFRQKPAGEILVLGLNAFVNAALPFGVTNRRHMRGEVMRAYRKPFPTWKSRWPVLAFPRHIPLSLEDAAYGRMKKTDEGLRNLKQPVWFVWGKRDPVFPARVMKKFKERLSNVKGETIFPDASHFFQEEKGKETGEAIRKFMDAN